MQNWFDHKRGFQIQGTQCEWVYMKIRITLSFIDEKANTESILREATKRIHSKYDFFETTLQIEVYGEEMEDCQECSNPQ